MRRAISVDQEKYALMIEVHKGSVIFHHIVDDVVAPFAHSQRFSACSSSSSSFTAHGIRARLFCAISCFQHLPPTLPIVSPLAVALLH